MMSMSGHSSLRKLAHACENAGGPDLELDLAIARAIEGVWGYRPHYTSSLEDALSLVPDGWEWATGTGREAHISEQGRRPWAWCVRSAGFALPEANVIAATPALALTAAALRARAAIADGSFEGGSVEVS